MDSAVIIQQIESNFPGAVVAETSGWIVLKKEEIVPVFRFLKAEPFSFVSLHGVTAVDRQETIELVYHLHSFQHRLMLTVKVLLPDAELTIESLTSLWEGANWLEREVYDLFGVRFLNHPNMTRLLNPESWSDHPLRKNFKRPDFILKPVK